MPSYILSEPYKQRVDRALSVVEGSPSKGLVSKIPTRLEGMSSPSGAEGQYINVRVQQAAYQQFLALLPSPSLFGVGSAIELNGALASRFVLLEESQSVSAEDDLIEEPSTEESNALITSLNALRPDATTDSFGIVTEISQAEESTVLRLFVAGVITCRVFAFAPSDRVSGPLPIPPNGADTARSLYRCYPTMSVGGIGAVLAVGRYWRVAGAEWPRVYEATIRV